jgi:uncharacterized protein (TIGR02996 family)
MDDEVPFIQAVQTAPGDTGLLLIYADWLEERGDPRAEFLRVRVALGWLLPTEKQFRVLWSQLHQLRSGIDPAWLAVLDRTPIENCPVQFAYSCPRQWEALRPTQETSVRFCEACQRRVYYCSTMRQARRHAEAGDCVAVDSMLNRRTRDLARAPAGGNRRVRLGVVALPSRQRSDEEEPTPSVGLSGRPRDGRRGNNRRRRSGK